MALATASLITLGPPQLAPAAQSNGPDSGADQQRIIVVWKAGASGGAKADARADAGVELTATLGRARFQLVETEPGQDRSEAIASLAADPAVASAEPDRLLAPHATPNDPYFGQLWGLRNLGTGIAGFSGAVAGADISALDAWGVTLGLPSAVVAVIDSGYRFDSPDLGPVAWSNSDEIPGNSVDDDANGYVDDDRGYDFVGSSADTPTRDADPTDDNIVSGGHGVHTAGTVGAAGNNGVGITGVAQDARIMPLRVCANSASNENAVRCPLASIVDAINYAGANGARIANLSLGGPTYSDAMELALVANPGTLYVVSAGNDGTDNDTARNYPCDYESALSPGGVENIVCVAATDQADQRAAFSNYGDQNVDLGAPGTEILSTHPDLENVFVDDFQTNDFATRWLADGEDGSFQRTAESPLTSFGISDSPGAAPVAGSRRWSTTAALALPSGWGSCRITGSAFLSRGGGSGDLAIYRNGSPYLSFAFPETGGTAMKGFTTAPLTGLAGSSIQLRVSYSAGSSPTAANGFWVDDLRVSCRKPQSAAVAYAFLQGTSMAAPHVSGAAALLFSAMPGASVAEVRHALLASVDPLPSLASTTSTGGRLDAAAALTSLAEDSFAAPELQGFDPASPGNQNNPRLSGSAASGTTVLVFRGAGCSGDPVASGSAAQLAAGTLEVPIPSEGEHSFSALAENEWNGVTPCSAPISYVYDFHAPAEPVLSISPESPANDNAPVVRGSAETGSRVDIYAGSGCPGAPVASGTAAELASTGIVLSVADDTFSRFSARAVDAAKNGSACSAPVAYEEDSTPPPAPTLQRITPVGPANDNEPRVGGLTFEEHSTIRLYANASCGGAPIGSGNGVALRSQAGIAVSVPDNSTTQIAATETDLAGNASACSAPISYTERSEVGTSTVIVTGLGPVAPPPPPPGCTVPKLAGKSLGKAKKALRAAGCTLGKVIKPKARKGQKPPALVVRSSTPGAGKPAPGKVDLRLGPKPKRR